MRKFFIGLKLIVLALLLMIRAIDLLGINAFMDDHNVLSGVFNVVVYLLSIELVKSLIIYLYRQRKGLKYPENDNFIFGIRNLFILFYTFGLFFLMLALTKVQFTNFVFSISIVAAALAITLKEFLSDIITSMLMTFSRELEVGDVIKIGEHKGKIVNMSLNKTAILTEDDDMVFLPNTKVYLSDIVNYTKRDIKKTSISFEIGIGIIQDVEEVENLLKNAVAEYKDKIRPDSYNLRILDIKKDYLSFKFQYILYKSDPDLEKSIRKKVIRAIYEFINKSEIPD
ncbi:MAG: mechanosensitive ion channel protein MscS [Saprospirales bacterium]|nr:MAG: mechanosensitive ion channel protein MscS [Saprospirales bacterium]